MKVLGISGSLRDDSYNTKLLRAAAELLPHDVEFELWDGLKAIPPYDEDDDVDPAPAPVAALRAAIAGADAVLFATPEYNSSIPGVLKNALDWVSRPLALEPAAEQAGGGHRGEHRRLRRGLGAGRAAEGARRRSAPASSKATSRSGTRHTRFDEDGRLRDEQLLEQLQEVVSALVQELSP